MLKMKMNPLLIWILVNEILYLSQTLLSFGRVYYLSVHKSKCYNLEEPSMLLFDFILIYFLGSSTI